MVIEPVIIAHGGFSALCNPRAAAQAGWGVDQIEKAGEIRHAPATAGARRAQDSRCKAVIQTVACVQPDSPQCAGAAGVSEETARALREAVHLVVPRSTLSCLAQRRAEGPD